MGNLAVFDFDKDEGLVAVVDERRDGVEKDVSDDLQEAEVGNDTEP